MKLSRKGIAPVRLEMTPLMDIIFLLLVFFIYAMMSMAVHHGKQLDLPQSSSAAVEMQEAVNITILSDKNGLLISVDGGESFSGVERLREILTEKKAKEPEGKELDLQIFADKTVSYQSLYSVLDSVSQAGLSRISLQASLQEAP
ncbi:ExbD/TolR family protein [Candidatus Electronema sp. TJ]|uniref:ExbD/TolR family protein n=1 Tax=Candidatus Electronema sp. TJ TaxID=3401573 RepID=UPI003AA7F202